jgi:hypothetical protein
MLGKLFLGMATAAMLVLTSPAQAHPGHCTDVFILSGADTGATRGGTNPGGVSCTANDPDVHPDTNFTVPGSTHLWVASFANLGLAPTGHLTIDDGEPIELTFTLEAVRGRWESQSISLIGVAPGATIHVVADVWGGGIEFAEVTYTRI